MSDTENVRRRMIAANPSNPVSFAKPPRAPRPQPTQVTPNATVEVTTTATPEGQVGGPKMALGAFVNSLENVILDGRMQRATEMLRADRVQLFSEVTDYRVTGVVKSQTDDSLFYACSIDKAGAFMCCTQNLNVCGGLRGKPCKHLLVLLVGLVKGDQLDPAQCLDWVRKTRGRKAALNKDAMSATFIKYKGAEAGEIDWRPTETIPEDYYAL